MHSVQLSLCSMPLILFLALLALLLSPTISTPRLNPKHSNAKTGFQLTLEHVDSRGNFTKFDLLQRAVQRGRKRLARLRALTRVSSNVSFKSPIHAADGEFLMDLAIGNPSLSYSAIIDTGSDLIWTQCKPCIDCFEQPTHIFNPENSSSYSKATCSSELCKKLPLSSCENGSCRYSYFYGTGLTQGVMATETFKFGKVSVPGIGFGCGHNNEGPFNGAGLVGLGRGELSLVSQMDEPKFSYCLASSFGSGKTSILSMGSRVSLGGAKMIRTPLIRNQYAPTFYYLSLHGITVGKTRLKIKKSTFELRKDGSGGIIIDSGTKFSYLNRGAFDLIKKEFTRQMRLRSRPHGYLDVCFRLPSESRGVKVPKFIFHFEGADLDLPLENYFFTDDRRNVGCLAMIGTDGDMSIFGNVQQQNTLVVYDLAEETLSFRHTQCDQF